jgi:hypothetical protein
VPLVAAAVCPHPPLLVPHFATGAADELAELRAACRAAVTLLLGASPDAVVVVGTGPRTVSFPAGTRRSLVDWGVHVPVMLGAPDGWHSGHDNPDLPLSVAIGAWLVGAPPRPVRGLAVRTDLTTAECAELGAMVADRPERTALLVMGDGTARRGEKAPGDPDDRAEPFDSDAARALGAGDADALLAIDPALATELSCSGRAAWQVLAGAAAAGHTPPRRRLLYHGAPYGVGYLVASWS